MKNFRSPAVPLRRHFDLAQHGAEVNRLAVVAAVILVGLWHAENFTQRRADAKQNYSLKVASAGGNRSRQ